MTWLRWLGQLDPLGLAALAVTCLAVGWLSTWLWRHRGLGRHPLLLALFSLGVAPALYNALVWSRALDERWLRLARPELALPLAALVVFIVLRLLGAPAKQTPWRRRLTTGFIALSLLAAEWAALGLEAGLPLDRLAVIVLVDRSRSIDLVPDADSRVERELSVAELSMREGDRIATIAFGATARVEDPLRGRSPAASPQRVEVPRDATDLAAALRRALAEVPADSAARIVLLSDGVATRGDALAAAAAATAAGIPVDVVPLDQERLANVRVAGVRLPPRAAAGEPIELRVVTEASRRTEVELRLLRDGELIRKGTVTLAEGEDVIRLRELAGDPGLHRYDVELSARSSDADRAAEDNAGSAFLQVAGRATALVLTRAPELARPLITALESASFHVDVVGPPAAPADVAGFAAYDLLALPDVPALDLAPTQLDAIATYVKDLGGGLLLLGGDRTLGPGGYGKTPIEEVSPLSFDLKQDQRRASLAQIIAIDYSGSMAMTVGGRTKLELANEAAARSAELLGEGDRLGVMHVDTTVAWTVPLAPVTDKTALARKIRGVSMGGGGIFIDLTLTQAYAALARETVNLKHLLLFSDGDDAEERAQAFALVASAKARGITTSVVALGRGQDVGALERMSQLGDGRFYLIEDARRLPAVFAQETILASRSAINEVSFRPALASSGPAVRGIDFSAAPPLGGYVVTFPKARAQVHLRGPDQDPVLATWSVGLGRAAAFTSDYSNRWGAAWTSWAPASQLFGQLGRDVARVPEDTRVRLQAESVGGELSIRATVLGDDGRATSFRRLQVHVGGPDGFSEKLALEAVGAGAYAATLPLNRPGTFVVTAVDEVSGKPVATTGAVLNAGQELRPTGSDRGMLRRIAELTRGEVRDTLAGVFHDRAELRMSYVPWSQALLMLAASALLLSVAARRWVLPEALARVTERTRRHWAERRQQQRARREQRRARAPGAGGALEALQRRKQRSEVAARPDPTAPAPAARPLAPPPLASGPAPGAAPAGAPQEPERPAPHPASPAARSDGSRPAPQGGSPKPAPLTTAEVLLARRRERQR